VFKSRRKISFWYILFVEKVSFFCFVSIFFKIVDGVFSIFAKSYLQTLEANRTVTTPFWLPCPIVLPCLSARPQLYLLLRYGYVKIEKIAKSALHIFLRLIKKVDKKAKF